METYIEDNLASPKFYLKSGVLEPVHLNLEERNILVSGLEETMNRCVSEIEAAQQLYIDQTKEVRGRNCRSQKLDTQKKNISDLTNQFLSQTQEKPWIFQKCSLRGLYITRECLGSIREDSHSLCYDEIKEYMEWLAKNLDKAKV